MNTRFITKLLFVGLLSTIFLGCASSQPHALKSIAVGMDKSDVLDKVGNPTRKTREHNQDRWSYEVLTNSKIEITHIYFESGKVTYVGPANNGASTPRAAAKGKFKRLEEPSLFKSIGQ